MTAKIDLVRSFMEVEGNLKLGMTGIEKDGSIRFSGSRLFGEKKRIEVTMDKHQVEAIKECEGVQEIYGCYKEMGYF